MNLRQEQELNQRVYRTLKKEINQSYPAGHYVAIVRGKIVADASSFRELLSKVEVIERNPDRRFVVQAGVDYPPKRIIRRKLIP